MSRVLRGFAALVGMIALLSAVSVGAATAQQPAKKPAQKPASGDPLKQAAREYNFEIRPTIGVVFPTDPDGLDTGWDIGASLRATPPGWDIGLQVDFLLVDLGENLFQATADALYQFSSAKAAFRPYIIAGLGLYDGNFGLNGGLGVDFAVVNAPVGFFLEARYHRVFDDPQDVGFIPLNAGVRIRF